MLESQFSHMVNAIHLSKFKITWTSKTDNKTRDQLNYRRQLISLKIIKINFVMHLQNPSIILEAI